MIKINLKKGGAGEREKSINPALSKALGKLPIPQVTLDASFIVLSLALIALAGIPHLFFVRYREHVQLLHKKDMSNLAEEEENIKTEMAKYQTYQAEIKNIEEQQSKVAQRLNIVKQLQLSRTGPVNILDSVGQSLPQRVWLNQIDLSLKEPRQIQLSGKSYSTEDIAEFVGKLNSSIYFEKVYLDGVSTAKERDSTGTEKSFLILAVPKLVGMDDRALAGLTDSNKSK